MFIRPEVMKFAEAMERKLVENEWKGGWKAHPRERGVGIKMSPGDLLLRAEEELEEVKDCDDDSELLGEGADVANFLMMLCDVKGLLRTEVKDGWQGNIEELKRKSNSLMRSGNMSAAIKLYNRAWEKERKRGRTTS